MNEEEKRNDTLDTKENQDQPLTEEDLTKAAGGYYNQWPGAHCNKCGAFFQNAYVYIQHIQTCKGFNG